MLSRLELGVVGLPHITVEELCLNDPSTVIQLVRCTADDSVSPYKGIISQDDELVRSGDFVELASCQVRCASHAVVWMIIFSRLNTPFS